MEHLFYNRWEDLARTLIVGVLAYVFLMGCLRWSGKRTLSKMNIFDQMRGKPRPSQSAA